MKVLNPPAELCTPKSSRLPCLKGGREREARPSQLFFMRELYVFAEEAFHSFGQLSHVQLLFRSHLNRTRQNRCRPICLVQKGFYTLATHLISIMNSGNARR
jgi:hypothetical protein